MFRLISCLTCCGAMAGVGALATPVFLQDACCTAETAPVSDRVSPGVIANRPAIEEVISDRTSINDVCPISGAPLEANSPIVQYHGFPVGVCCEGHGEAFLANMAEKDRDGFVAKNVEFVKSGCAVTGCQCPTYKEELLITHDGVVAPLCCHACARLWQQADEQQRDDWFAKFVKPALASDAAVASIPPNACDVCGDLDCSGTCKADSDVSSFDGAVYQIEGMTCDACANVVENAIAGIDGVESVDVSFEQNQATVTFDSPNRPDERQLIGAVEEAGFKAQLIETSSDDQQQQPQQRAISLNYTTGANFAGCAAGGALALSVNSLEPNSPAAKAGLEEGDIIVAINDVQLSDLGVDELAPRLQTLLNTPDPITFTVDRIDEMVDITVTPIPTIRTIPTTPSIPAKKTAPVAPGALDNDDDAGVAIPLLINQQAAAVEVMVNGKGPYRFDLGFFSGPSQLSPELIEQLGLTPDDADQVRLQSLRIGDMSFEGVLAKTAEPDDLRPASDETSGVLSLDVFAGHLVTFDFVKDELRIAPGTLASSGNGEVVAYELVEVDESKRPSVDLVIGDQTVKAYLSSSVMATIHFPTKLIDSLPLASPPGVMGRVRTPKGESVILGGELTTTLRVGGLELPEARIRFSDLFEHPSIGIGALMNGYEITFDHANRRLRIHEPKDRESLGLAKAAAVANLTEGEADIRTAFNANSQKTRLVMILSPT